MSAKTKQEHNANAVIAIEHLSKAFGSLKVLNDLSLNLFPEENLVVLGKSGSGKSVLIKLIVGLLKADKGSIKVFDQDVTTLKRDELDVLRQKIGFLFQSAALYDSMSVRQNMAFPLERIRKDLDEKQRTEKIMEVLESVGLADAVDKMPSELSGGMRKRIGLARTIVVDPIIMLYDEPTTGLDPSTSDEISQLILDVQKKYKTASIIITHDIACARIVANRLLMIQDGTVYKEGILKDFETSDDKIIQSFFKSI
ncbi:MAG TPA: ABC transporter ATP-binding protein [Bacteroidetes bacterium]|nr:ABC transporter ATP-binding protein [Bacteroidota bacterium]